MVQWYECKVAYDKNLEQGLTKVNELYLINALSFTEAEKRIIEYATPYVSMGALEVTNIKRALYAEMFLSSADKDDRYYKARVNIITIDERSGKEKKTGLNILVQSDSLANALAHLLEQLGKEAQDYEVASIAETQLLDVVPYESQQ